MSGIKAPIQDILTKLTAINVLNADHNTVPLYSRIWNNQLNYLEEGKSYDFPTPAVFVEIVNSVTFEILGQGFRSANLGVKIHLVHVFYNLDGTFEQDLAIFDLRDQILANFDNPANPGLSNYCPTGCTPLVCIHESQDYDHSNVYHYILEFICNFVDSKGSPYDSEAGKYFDTANPDLDASIIDGGIPAKIPDPDPEFIIPIKPI